MLRILVAAGLLICLGSSSWAEDCSDVLKDGTFKKSTYDNSTYVKQLVMARYASMTKEERDAAKDASGKAVIYGIPMEGAYSEDEHESWAQDIRSSLDVENILNSATSIFLTEGDSAVVNAWSGCMAQGGVALILDSRAPANPGLKIIYKPRPGTSGTKQFVEGDLEVVNAEITSGQQFVKSGAELRDVDRRIGLRRIKSDRPIVVRINTSAGGAEAILAAAKTPPDLPKRVCSLQADSSQTGQCSKSGQVYVGPHSPHLHWGTCISASPCELQASPSTDKNCTAPAVYVGPNAANLHGGHCLAITGSDQRLRSEFTTSKSCKANEVYAGPNAADLHGGSCVSLVTK